MRAKLRHWATAVVLGTSMVTGGVLAFTGQPASAVTEKFRCYAPNSATYQVVDAATAAHLRSQGYTCYAQSSRRPA